MDEDLFQNEIFFVSVLSPVAFGIAPNDPEKSTPEVLGKICFVLSKISAPVCDDSRGMMNTAKALHEDWEYFYVD